MASRGRDGPAAARASAGPLTPSLVYVRVRPTAAAGSGHTDGEAVAKKLDKFDDTTLTVKEDDLRKSTDYTVTKVIQPDAEQERAFEEITPELLEGFWTDTNILFFAYGQTGSGKTHTMLGNIESLSSDVPVPGWGLFPRIVHATLETMKRWRREGTQSMLLASAVEFYCTAAFDLNSKYRDTKDEVTLDSQSNLFGAKRKQIKSVKGLAKWVSRMYANRYTAKTEMNDASSRSHCAFVLTLLQVRADDTYVKTTFSLIDMAGSERSSKTGGERVGAQQASIEAGQMLEAGTPDLLSIGAQGTLINWEISFITTEIMKAADMHKKGMPFRATKESSTAASFYFTACCDGRARLGSCVTVSQSPQHGFETWFSLQYAQQLTECCAPLVKVRPVPIGEALEAAEREAEEAASKYDKDKAPQTVKQHRVQSLQRGAAGHTAAMLGYLKRLMEQRGGPAEAESDGISDGPWESPLNPKRIKVDVADIQQSALEMGEINEGFQVFIRIRPLMARETSAGAENCMKVSDVENFPRDPPPQRIAVTDGSISAAEAKASFVFNRVFEDAHGQADVFAGTAEPYVADFLKGTNVTIFAYGQTGTGKTHTIAGPPSDPGIVSRCLTAVCDGLAATGKELYYEYVQLYMNSIKDLLVSDSPNLKTVEGKDGNVYLQGVSTNKGDSADAVLRDLETGQSRRATRSQDMNAVSSRSHAVLILRLVEPGTSAADIKDNVFASMFIVDLAGSEKTDRSGVSGQGFEEATAINQSLTALGRVVIALIEKQRFIPYNGHDLTTVLKGGIGGNSKTALIACVTQASDSMSESINTLRFAMQASHVKNKVAKKDAADQRAAAAAAIEESGNSLTLDGSGMGTVPLDSGPIEVMASMDGPADRVAILIPGLDHELESLRGIMDSLASKGCRVICPKLPGTTQRALDGDVAALLALLDWIGVAKPVIFGRDWGAIRAIKFKIDNPKRVKMCVLEEFQSKVKDPKVYKDLEKRDMMAAMGLGAFMWFWNGTFPSTGDLKPSSNMNGWKGKAVLLWPFTKKGQHDPRHTVGMSKGASTAIAKCFKTTPTDSYLMEDADYASTIDGCF